MKIYSYSVHKETEILAALINAVTERMSWKCKLQIHFSPTDKVIVDTRLSFHSVLPLVSQPEYTPQCQILADLLWFTLWRQRPCLWGRLYLAVYRKYISYRNADKQGPTDHGHRQHAQRIWCSLDMCVVPDIYERINKPTMRQTDRQTQYFPFRFFKSQIPAEVGNANLPSKYSLVYWCDSPPVKNHSYHPQRNHCDWSSWLRAAWYLYNAVGPMYWHAEVLGHGQRVVGPG